MNKENLHHAYLVLGETGKVLPLLINEFEEMGIVTRGNPDFFIYESEKFGVEESRLISARAAGKAFTERKIFIIKSPRLTSQAQNALLKTFEEPPANTHFFLLAREENLLLPTLLSRMMIIRREGEAADISDAEAFLALPVKQRLDLAKVFADKEKDLPSFLDNIQELLRMKKRDFTSLRKVYDLRRFASDTSAAPRLMLEHLALVL